MAKKIIIIKERPVKYIPQSIQSKAEFRRRYSAEGDMNLPPTWGKVLKISGINHVDIELSNGLALKFVPVVSKRWVTKKDDESYTGCKDIPPVGSKVLLIFPDGILENVLVWGSGFDSDIKGQKDVLLKTGEETIEVDIDEFGWKRTRDKETGNIIFESPDDSGGKKIIFTIDIDNNVVSISQAATSTNKVLIESDVGSNKVTFEHQFDASKKNSIISDSDKLEIKEQNNNTSIYDSNGIKHVDANNNTVEMSTSGVKLQTASNTLEVPS